MNPADGRRLLEEYDAGGLQRGSGDRGWTALRNNLRMWLWEHREALVEAAERDATAKTLFVPVPAFKGRAQYINGAWIGLEPCGHCGRALSEHGTGNAFPSGFPCMGSPQKLEGAEPEPIGETCAECGEGCPAPGRSWCQDCIDRYVGIT